MPLAHCWEMAEPKSSNTRQEYRRHSLLGSLYSRSASTLLVSPIEVAQRILNDINIDLTKQASIFGPAVVELLQRPIPYDSANPLKQTLMPELMQPAGKDLGSLRELVWGKLKWLMILVFSMHLQSFLALPSTMHLRPRGRAFIRFLVHYAAP